MSTDTARQEAFTGLMVDVLNKGALALLVSVGHQTGLFDTLSTLPPSTSQEIAEAAHLDERYVREAGRHGRRRHPGIRARRGDLHTAA
ncbi:hypothetical protein [Actinomadura monticuli]|uniref:S-adenosylmethionine-dependent methyltransferase Rv2258c-like winged HTH domain-containing protein n=1 Tax=Actinomadura monticuli TaxID=3097367 RepID=A0ABV4QKQ2_9ACTN